MIDKKIKSIFQILTLVVAIFSFAYFIAPSIGSVSALENCCPRMKNGAVCQEIASTSCASLCNGECQEASCANTGECQSGCCIQSDGTCSANSPKAACSAEKWNADASCNIAECQKACCIIGSTSYYTTSANCNFLAGSNSKEFKAMDEMACLSLSANQPRGACLLEGGRCKVTTKPDCFSITKDLGAFSEGKLCSAPELNTSCTRQDKKDCVSGKEEVYWLDSCGNPENIFNANRDASWNFGRVLSKNQSCGAGAGNMNSNSCGNCDYTRGSKCSERGGEAKCMDLNCKDGDIMRRNGESWCVYDGSVGNGTDIVGSRHWKYVCTDGEIKVEPCEDYRQEVCAERSQVIDGVEVPTAECIKNEWRSCLLNFLESGKNNSVEDCTNNPFCALKKVDIDKGFSYDACTPAYPTGFDLGSANYAAGTDTSVCGIATRTCTVVYQCGCKQNCDCEKPEFAEKMNDWCTSLGDCGGEANIAGEYSEGYSVSGSPKLSGDATNKYKAYASSSDGQPVFLDNITGEDNAGISAGQGIVNEQVLTDLGEGDNGESEESGKGGCPLAPIIAGLGGAMVLSPGTFATSFAVPAITDTATNAVLAEATGPQLLGLAVPVWGWILLAVGLILMMSGGGGAGASCPMKTKQVTFTCKRWQAPFGGENCEQCNADKMKPCSAYRCASLGRGCEFINEGTVKEACVWTTKGDSTAPKISIWQDVLTKGYKYVPQTFGFELKESAGACIQEATPVLFGIETDEFSQCRIATNRTSSFDDMPYEVEGGMFSKQHGLALNMPDRQAFGLLYQNDNLTAEQIALINNMIATQYGQQTLYLRCVDKNGNGQKASEYAIKFCLRQGPDKTPPVITATKPVNGAYLKYGATSANLTVWTNELATCKWNREDKPYEQMAGNFSFCETNVGIFDIGGYRCRTNIPGLTEDENNVYIRCKDQPWLPETNKSRNAMTESYVWAIGKTNENLTIAEILPTGVVKTASEPATVELSVRTEGGGGSSSCKYSFSGWSSLADFVVNDGNLHSQVLNRMSAGNKHVYVECTDSGDNVARAESSFRVELDRAGPVITRMFNKAGLTIWTDENSECVYDLKNCEYNFVNGTSMTGNEREHTADWNLMAKYYIKCKDAYGTEGACSTIRAYEVRE